MQTARPSSRALEPDPPLHLPGDAHLQHRRARLDAFGPPVPHRTRSPAPSASVVHDTRDDPLDPHRGALPAAPTCSCRSDVLGGDSSGARASCRAATYQAPHRAAPRGRAPGASGLARTFGDEAPLLPAHARPLLRRRRLRPAWLRRLRGTRWWAATVCCRTAATRSSSAGPSCATTWPAPSGSPPSRRRATSTPLVSDMSTWATCATPPGWACATRAPVGPLRFDWGYKLDRRPARARYHLHFTIGTCVLADRPAMRRMPCRLGSLARSRLPAARAAVVERDPGRGGRVDGRPLLLSEVAVLAARARARRGARRSTAAHRRAAHVPRGRAPSPGRAHRGRGRARLREPPRAHARAGAGTRKSELRRMARRQATILKYVDFRFRPQVRVSDEAVRAAYDAQPAPAGAVLRGEAAAGLRARLARRGRSRRRDRGVGARSCAGGGDPLQRHAGGRQRPVGPAEVVEPDPQQVEEGRRRRPEVPTRVASSLRQVTGTSAMRKPRRRATNRASTSKEKPSRRAGAKACVGGGRREELEAALRVAAARAAASTRTHRLKRRPMFSRYQGWRTSTFDPGSAREAITTS